MSELTADDKIDLHKWSTETTADGKTRRRPWATSHNADLAAFIKAERERTGSLDKAKEAADEYFAPRPQVDPMVELRAIKQYSNRARNALIDAERRKENGNPNRQISETEVQAKARAMYLDAHQRYG